MSEFDNYDDYNDPNEENEYDAIYGTKKNTPWKIFKKIVKVSLKIFSLLFMVAIFLRIFITKDTSFSKTFLWTVTSISAYNKNPDEFLAYYYKHPDNLSQDGKFSASNVYFVPSISQIQITVRYNDSTLKKLQNEYKLKEVPKGEVFVFTLTDNLGNVYKEYTYAEDKKNLYNYRRVVFENIDMNATKTVTENEKTVEKKFDSLYINIYYADDVLLSKPFDTITVYDTIHFHEPINMNKHKPKENKPSELKERINYQIKEEPAETE